MIKNNLYDWCIKNGKEYLIDEWDYERNKTELELDIKDVTFGSNKKVWWKCKKMGHEWMARIKDRTDKLNRGCPYCSNRKVLKGYNDFETWCKDNNRNDLLEEWDYSKNKINPDEITKGSGKNFWWTCKKGHSWKSEVKMRSTRGDGCPKCLTYGTSFPEQYLYHSLKSKFNNASNRTKINGYEYDIFIEELNLLIEYDGIYWHRVVNDKTDREKQKAITAKEEGFDFIRVKEVKSKDNPKIKKQTIKINKRARVEDLISVFELIIDYINDNYGLNLDKQLPDNIEQLSRGIIDNSSIPDKDIFF